MNNAFTVIWSNPHLRYGGMVIAILEIAKIWFPSYEKHLDETCKLVQYYLIAIAATTTPTPPTEKK